MAVLWLLLLLAAAVLWWRSDIALTEIPDLLHGWLSALGLPMAALIYIVFYVLRPLIFFPPSLLALAAGLVFGPWLGIVFTIIGENLSAVFAFLLARWFGRQAVAAHEHDLARRWDERLRRNGLVAVMIMRLIYIPFDVVNFGCGLTAISLRDFTLGTFIGVLPSIIAFVLLGGAGAAGVGRRLDVLILSIVFFFFGLILARWLHRREERKNPPREE